MILDDFGLYLSNLLTFFIKIIYPLYSTFKSIKSENKNDDTVWLLYWVTFGFFSFFEEYIVPFVYWVPFFMIIRILFYLWLQLPYFNGSVFLFKKIVRPFFEQAENSYTNSNDIFEDFKTTYYEILKVLPQPDSNETSSPSAEPSE